MIALALESQLDFIRRRLSGETVSNYRPSPSAEYSLAQIGQLTGLNLLSGYEPRERALARLYERLSGSVYRGPMAAEVILSAIQQSTSFSILDSLVAYWPLAKDGAVYLLPTAGDLSLGLTNNNSVSRAAGPSANLPDAASFAAASSQYLSTAGASSPNLAGLTTLTICGWVYFTTIPAAVIIFSRWDLGSTPNQKQVSLNYVGGATQRFNFFASRDGTTNGTPAASGNFGDATTGTWYFVVCQVDGAVLRVSVNLGAYNTGTIGGTGTGLHAATVPFLFGAQLNNGSPASFLNGRLSSFTIESRIIPDSELFWLYNNGQGRDLARGV